MVHSKQRRAASDGLSRRQLLGGCAGVAVAAGASAAIWKVRAEPGPEHPEFAPRPRRVDVIFDATDRLTSNQLQALTTELHARLDKLAVGDTISLDAIVPSEKGPIWPLFAEVKRKTCAQANPLFENCQLIQRDYDAFIARFAKALEAVAEFKEGSRTSPIVEAIWTVARRSPGPIDEIDLWSDMVNASGAVNHFSKTFPRCDESLTRKLPFIGLEALNGATVTINQLALNTKHQTRALTEFWDAYWRHAGAGKVTWRQVPA